MNKDYQNSLAYQLLNFYGKLIEPLSEDLEPYGITAKNFFILEYISYNPGASQQDVSNAIHKNKALIRQIMDKLVKLDYVRRERGQDKRLYELYLTKKGEELVDRYQGVIEESKERLLSSLTEEEKDTFESAMKRLSDE